MHLQATPWGPSPYRTFGEKAISLAKAAKATSVALMLPSSGDTAVPEGESRRHEHVHDVEKRVSNGSAATSACVHSKPRCGVRYQLVVDRFERPSMLDGDTSVRLYIGTQAGDIALGLLLGGYKMTRFKTEAPPPPVVERAVIFSLGADPQMESTAQQVSKLARGVMLTRCLSKRSRT